MYKNQLQELAQRSCFNLPAYVSIREGPDHAPRFKASVNFNGEIFESRTYSTTLRQAEHAAAEVALNSLSARGPSKSLTARVLDETGVYKNLLQETAHRAGLKLPVYITIRSGPGHIPVFTSTVELAGVNFTGESAKTKKQAEKNAAIAAWSSLKRMPNLGTLFKETEDQEHVVVGRVLSNLGQRSESRVMRRRDQFQPRRRMQRSFSEKHQWTSKDLVLGSNLECFEQKQKNSYLSLLPPPPPRTVSKILPPNLTKDFPPFQSKSLEIKDSPQVQKGDNERIEKITEEISNKPIGVEGSSGTSSSSILYGLNAEISRVEGTRCSSSFLDGPNADISRTQIRITILDPKTPPKVSIPPPFKCSSPCTSQMGPQVQRDDNERIDEVSEQIIVSKSIAAEGSSGSRSYLYRPNADISRVEDSISSSSFLHGPNAEISRTQNRITIPNPKTPPKISFPPPFKCSSPYTTQMGRSTITEMYHPQRIAPAVQIRSVIPVCSAPPVRPRTSPSMKETASSPSSTTSSSSKDPVASSFSKLKL